MNTTYSAPPGVLARLKSLAIIPIVRSADPESALHAAEALLEAGIACVEITMTVSNALRALESIAARYGDTVLLGAGTVLDPETARACILAGARFLVSPALNPATIRTASRYSIPIFPGALTPTEVLAAWEAGADAVKIFPANAVGGPSYIRALKAPFPHIELIPTGGVNLETIGHFLAAGCAAVGVGSELVDPKLVTAGHYSAISARARQFLSAISAVRAQ